jgi:hypothetical protein
MKTKNIKTLVCGLFLTITSLSFAQSLVVKGKFLTGNEKRTTAYYTLLCEDNIIEKGTESNVKLKLVLNKEYVLIISKIGFKSKVIRFSTYTDSIEKFNYNFEAILQEDSMQKKHVQTAGAKNVIIYYHEGLEAFCQATRTFTGERSF